MNSNPEAVHTRKALIFLSLLTLFRLWFCTWHELIEDEAYYFLWSQHLDWSYYSKGPLIAFTIRLGTLLGGDTVFGIRWISVLLSAFTGWQIFRLGSRLFSPRIGFVSMAVAATIPLYAVGSILMTIDPLSVFFWAWGANLFLNALEDDRSHRWALLGLCMGFGFLGKFINAIQIPCFALYLLAIPHHRHHFRNPRFYLMLGVFLLCTFPVLWWNTSHGWITATHLKERGAMNREIAFRPGKMITFLAMQTLVISPLFFVGLWISVTRVWRKFRRSESHLYPLCLFAPVFLFYWILSLNNAGEANWTATSFVGGIVLSSAIFVELTGQSIAWKRFASIALILAILQTALLHDTFPLHLPPKKDPLTRLRGWKSLAENVQQARIHTGATLLIGNKYQTSSILHFYLPDRPVTHIPHSNRIENQFSFWPSYPLPVRDRALFVTDSQEAPPEILSKEFQNVILWNEFQTTHLGRAIKLYRIYLCVPHP